MHIERLKGHATGRAWILDGRIIAYEKTADTDLEDGTYRLTADKPEKRWRIGHTGGGLRFILELDGADPWALQYKTPIWLSVEVRDIGENPSEEFLDGIGAEAYSADAKYIDRVMSGSYAVDTGAFTVKHEDGSTIELDYDAVLGSLRAQGEGTAEKGAGTIYVYFRNLKDGKIYPRIFDKKTTPNIAHMVLETEAARSDAELLGKSLKMILELLPVSTGSGNRPPKAPRQWKATPRSNPLTALRPVLGIHGDPPQINVRLAKDALLHAKIHRLTGYNNEVVYEMYEMIALGEKAGMIRAAQRQMLLAAAEKARATGHTTFKILGRQANENGRAHGRLLAAEIGRSGSYREVPSGFPGLQNFEIIAEVQKVFQTN